MSAALAVTGSMALGIGLLAGPASADSHTDGIVAAAQEMLHEADVPASLGTPTGHAFSAQMPADTPLWLCTTNKDINAPGPRTFYDSIVSTKRANPDGVERGAVSEFEFVYASRSSAQSAWKKAVTRAKKCTGTWTQSDWTGVSEDRYRARVSNGRVTVLPDGPQAIWIAADMSDRAEGSSWAMDQYSVYVLSGNTVEMTQFSQDSDDPITARQRSAVRSLAAELANDSAGHAHD